MQIPRMLQNSKVHYHVHESSSSVPVLSQINPVYTFPSLPRSSKWLSYQNFLCAFLCAPMLAECPASRCELYVQYFLLRGGSWNLNFIEVSIQIVRHLLVSLFSTEFCLCAVQEGANTTCHREWSWAIWLVRPAGVHFHWVEIVLLVLGASALYSLLRAASWWGHCNCFALEC
jgi:hypothetical protein